MAVGDGLSFARMVYISLTVVDNLANISMAFGSAGGSCTMLTVLSLQIVILWLSIIS